MEIVPLRNVGPLLFGVSARDVEEIIGPSSSSTAAEQWNILEFEGDEIMAAYFRSGKLSSVMIRPTVDTTLWGKSLVGISASEIDQLIKEHGGTAKHVAGCHPAIRDRLDLPELGLFFYLDGGRCDSIVVGQGTTGMRPAT
jgi:hypothetical protein